MIKAKLKICDGCGEPKPIWKNHEGEKFCKQCWSYKKPPVVPKPRPPIKQKSEKRTKEERIYLAKRIIFLSENPVCQMALPFCTVQATDVHHMEGRVGENYLDVSKWKACCRQCHVWTENNPEAAKQLGHSQKRI